MNPQDANVPVKSQLPPVMSQDSADSTVDVAAGSVNAQNNQTSGIQTTSSGQSHLSVQTASNGQESNSKHAPSIADDNDLIEKEWVNKAKMIIAKTKDDPREQSTELFKYKADYIKQRYNKDIKVSES